MAASPTTLHTTDTGGPGRPVVLIHGWPLSGKSWSHQIDVFKDAGYRVITYDRRGFGESEKPSEGYDYDTFADDLQQVLESLRVEDATLVGFSMGGGEVARYASRHGLDRVRSVVFAAAVPPYLLQGPENPEGPLDEASYKELRGALEQDREAFFDEFTTGFFSVGDRLTVSENERQQAIELARQSDQGAALGAMDAWATTDFRANLTSVTVPALVIHGDGDATVPLEGSAQRTHQALSDSSLVVIEGAPHGFNVSHAEQFNSAVLDFLRR